MYAGACADSSSPISLIELMNIDMKTLFGKIAAPSGLLKTAPHLMDTDGHRFFVFSIENPSVFIRVHLTRRQPSGRPKKNTCIHYLKKLSTFSFALLALCFALSCSSSTSHVIKSKSSPDPRFKSYEKILMRELRNELAQRHKEGFPNILKGSSGTYVYDTKKQEYVLRKRALSKTELRVLAGKKPSSSPHHSKARYRSYKRIAMRELRNDLAQRRKEGFPNLVEGPSGPYIYDTEKQEYILDQRLIGRRKTEGLNKNEYVLRGSLSRDSLLTSRPLPLSPKLRALKKTAPPLAEKYQKENREPPNRLTYKSQAYLWDSEALSYGLVKEKASPEIEPRLLASKKPSPPVSTKPPQAKAPPPVPTKPPQARASAPVPRKPPQTATAIPIPTKPPQARASAPVSTKPSQTATAIPIPTKPPQAVASAPALPKTTASQAKAKPIARKKRQAVSRVKRNLSKEDAAILLYKIDKALKEHSKEDTDVRDFLVRAYRRYYRKDKLSVEDARRIMGLGLAYRGSLKAIMRCMKRQYPEVHMRHYAFSKIFKITRHEAKKVFAVYGGNGS